MFWAEKPQQSFKRSYRLQKIDLSPNFTCCDLLVNLFHNTCCNKLYDECTTHLKSTTSCTTSSHKDRQPETNPHHLDIAKVLYSLCDLLSEHHTEPTVFTVRPVRSMRTVTPTPRLFLLCWHRRDVDPSDAEDNMKPPRSSPAFISRSN